MNMLKQLLEKKRLRDKKPKEPTKSTQDERPLSKILDFLTLRQETRFGLLFALRSQNHVIEEPELKSLPAPKGVVSYVS